MPQNKSSEKNVQTSLFDIIFGRIVQILINAILAIYRKMYIKALEQNKIWKHSDNIVIMEIHPQF